MKLGAPVDHLLIDLDGTLLGNHTVALSLEFLKQAISALRPYGGLGKAAGTLLAIGRELTGRSSDERTNDVRIVELFSKRLNLSLEEGRRVLKEGVQVIFPGLQKHFYPMPGAKDFLDWAKNHYPMTLATNPIWPVEIIELRVRWAGIDPKIFGSITHIRQMRAYKPAREYYEDILMQQGLKAEGCLLVGNDVRMDLPATRVGIRVFIVERDAHVSHATKLNSPGTKAAAWKGSYTALRNALEKSRS